MRISVIGCGYLGAVHAAAMAKLGHDVVGVDRDARKIDKLSRGVVPFFEPGLPELLVEGLQSGRLRLSTGFADAADASVHIVAVGTPQLRDGDAADLTYVMTAIDALAPIVSDDALIVGKSTVPVATATEFIGRLRTAGCRAALA